MIRCLGPGVRVTWATLPGKPTTFAPAPHTHAYGDLAGIPSSFPPSAHTHAWADVTGKPNLYPPSSHTHLWADITDKPAAFAPSAHTHAWSEITSKPTTFTPSAHTHLWADITDKPTTFPPATHTHAGLLQLVGTVTVTETTLVSLAVGMKRMTLTLAGITAADMGKLLVVPNGTATAGCEVQNAYPAGTNSVSIGYYTPALGLATTYTIPVAVYRVT